DAKHRRSKRRVWRVAARERHMQRDHELSGDLRVGVPQAGEETGRAGVEERQIQADPFLAHHFGVPEALRALAKRACAQRHDARVELRSEEFAGANGVLPQPERAVKWTPVEESAVAGEMKHIELRPPGEGPAF